MMPGARPPGQARPHFPVQPDSGGVGFITAAWGPIPPAFPHISDPGLCPLRLRGRLNWSVQKMASVSPAPLPPRALLFSGDFESLDSDLERKSSNRPLE